MKGLASWEIPHEVGFGFWGERTMHDVILGSTRDTLLIAIPLLGLLAMGVLRLDEVIFSSSKGPAKQHQRAMCGVDEQGQPILTDPDGRVWKKRPNRR
jgi:hypothetical protein